MKKKIIGAKHKKICFKRKGGENVCWIYWEIIFQNIKKDFIRKNYSISTIRNLVYFWKKFLKFIKTKEIMYCKNLTRQNVKEYVEYISDLSINTIGTYVAFFRHFLKYLYLNNLHKIDLTYSIPKIKRYKSKNIPHTIWTIEEINKILNAVDTSKAMGKRDYAILMLISHLGFRISDIKDLKFSNIDWKNNIISINQRKTKKLVTLPLSNKIGMSLIDYIKCGRPNSTSPYVFLSTYFPYDKLSHFNNLSSMFKKYLMLANIDISNKKLIGVHSLRHSISSILLQNNTPLSIISPILGHSSIETTDIYLKIDIEHLRECCLEVL